jgi:hypothetical protein
MLSLVTPQPNIKHEQILNILNSSQLHINSVHAGVIILCFEFIIEELRNYHRKITKLL